MWCLYASEIAALVGKHLWQNQYEAILKILARHGHVKFQSKYERMQQVIKTIELKSDSPETPLQKRKIEEHVTDAVRTHVISQEDAKLVLEQTTRLVNQSTGQVEERQVVKAENIQLNNSKLYRTQLGDRVTLMGRVDGFRDGVLTELKRRMRTIQVSQLVPSYDLLQCMCYLKLTGEIRMMLVETDKKQHKRETQVLWNERRWKELETDILRVVDDMERLLSQTDVLRSFVDAGTSGRWDQCQMLWFSI